MPENPPEKEDFDCEEEKTGGDNENPNERGGAWREDQKKHGYYYDDAHGYEIYRDDEDDSEES